ncbi:triose-phosphate isomerase [bacterium]|nr:triose-phosphate isomerase [bacterium]
MRSRDAAARTPIIAGNWKMHKTYAEAVSLTQGIIDRLPKDATRRADVVLCPPFTALRGVSNAIAFDHARIKVGAQDCSAEPEGAYTGQVSVAMIADLDAAYAIVGHSERRGLLGETSADVAAKARALCAAGLTPIVCVGESREVYEAGDTIDFVVDEVAASLAGVRVDADAAGLCVAYEPIWAIGTGLVPSPEHAQRVAAAIRAQVGATCGAQVAERARVLYGGSVKPGNVAAFMVQQDVDGALVGGASLDADTFVRLVLSALGE